MNVVIIKEVSTTPGANGLQSAGYWGGLVFGTAIAAQSTTCFIAFTDCRKNNKTLKFLELQ